MSGTRLPLLSRDTDPLDDSLNLEWDAIVRNERPAPPEIDPDDFDLLRRVHTQANRALPDPDFFSELESRLTGLYGLPASKPVRQARVSRDLTGTRPKSRERMRPALPPNRWLPVLSALAVLVLLLAAGIVVLLRAAPRALEAPAIPAAVVPKPERQTIAQFDFVPPMWDMPDATTWIHMEAVLIEVLPGKSFTTQVGWFTDFDGPLLITVFSGELAVTPSGPALVFTANSPQHPQDVAPGQMVLLAPSDTIVYSAADGANATNLGTEPVNGLYGLVGKEVPDTPGGMTYPAGVRLRNIFALDDLPPLPGSGASVSIQRLELAPFDSYVNTAETGLRIITQLDLSAANGLRKFDGALDSIPLDAQSGNPVYGLYDFYNPPGEPETFINLGDSTIDIYFLVMEPYPNPATPTP